MECRPQLASLDELAAQLGVWRNQTLDPEDQPVDPADQRVEWMDPADIKYTQAYISGIFSQRLSSSNAQQLQEGKQNAAKNSNSNSSGGFLYAERLKTVPPIKIADTLQRLKNGDLKVDQIEPIRVCKHRNVWYSLDNRRLWVFKQYGARIPVEVRRMEDVSKEFFQKFVSREDGKTVSILEYGARQNSNANSKNSIDRETFFSTVLKWSIENIRSRNMYVNKVRENYKPTFSTTLKLNVVYFT